MQKSLIFERYPKLQEKINWMSLGNFPTPITKLEKLGKVIGGNNLYLKRDDVSGDIYGGNKVRKLEFTLPDAKRKNKDYVLTLGAAGSNHCVATTIYAKKIGIKNISLLFPQPNTKYLQKNLLLQKAFGGEIKYLPSVYLIPFAVIFQMVKKFLKTKKFPYYLPAGGSSVLGCIGYVNAAFELKKQIDENIIPEPDFIFVAAGTCGTAAGLELGVRALNLKSKIISVRVVDKIVCNQQKISKLANKTSLFLHKIDHRFPKIEIKSYNITFLTDYFGDGYAKFTEKGIRSIKLIKELENIELEGTYTGKAMAGLIDWCSKKDVHNKTILFWNTYNSQDMSGYLTNINFTELPLSLQKYFNIPLQDPPTLS